MLLVFLSIKQENEPLLPALRERLGSNSVDRLFDMCQRFVEAIDEAAQQERSPYANTIWDRPEMLRPVNAQTISQMADIPKNVARAFQERRLFLTPLQP